ncbi:MAG: VWA domain-containing protein [Acidobacteriaceae bacterium]|jgi:VWFA-related protein
MQAAIDSCRIGMLFACLMGSAVLAAQQPAGVQSENGVYTLHADTHLALLDVTVMDKQGHPVTGLTKDDFKLQEDGQPQTIKFFEEHAPVDPAEIAKEKAAALAAQTKFFDEHEVPVDPAEIARQKAAAIAGQPLSTFTNYEPFTGRPVTVLLLNELFPRAMMKTARAVNQAGLEQRPGPFQDPLHRKMLDLVQNAPPETPFVVYRLDSQLRLIQPITTDRALLLAKIDLLWKSPTPQLGSEQMIDLARRRYFVPGLQRRPNSGPEQIINPTGLSPDADISVRRTIFTDAMQQLASSLEGVQGRKNLYVFTGPFQCSVVQSGTGCAVGPFPDDNYYLCKWMDALEQGRMSIYRYYGQGNDFAHGFGCSRSVDLGTSANYYTLYYTPTNGNWDGKYRATKIEVTEKDLHLAYRQGYYGTPENTGAHYYAAKRPGAATVTPSPGGAGSGGQTIAASTVPAGTAAPERPGTGVAPVPPNPVSAVFSVQVVPASATSGADNEKEEYRQLTLHFSMPANEFKVVQSGSGQYVARLLISAVGYSDGNVASSNGSQAVQMAVNFNGAADPRIATSTITAEMTLNELEHGKERWLLMTVRDQETGQFGSMVIPMEQVKMPEKQ